MAGVPEQAAGRSLSQVSCADDGFAGTGARSGGRGGARRINHPPTNGLKSARSFLLRTLILSARPPMATGFPRPLWVRGNLKQTASSRSHLWSPGFFLQPLVMVLRFRKYLLSRPSGALTMSTAMIRSPSSL